MNERPDSLFPVPQSGAEPRPYAGHVGLEPAPLDFRNAGFVVAPPVERQQVIGLPGPADRAPAPVPTPVVVPRPRRWIVSCVILAIAAGITHWIWSSSLKHVALGIVSGETIFLSTEAEGFIQEVRVDTGEEVHRGELLLTLQNQTWRNELARFQDELRTATAEATAAEAQLEWQQVVAQDGQPRAQSDYYEALGRLRDEEARLESMGLTNERMVKLKKLGVASEDEADRVRLAHKGQMAKVEEIEKAVRELKARVERGSQLIAHRDNQLRPKQARVEFLQGEIDRWERRIAQLEIKAPVDGVVLMRYHQPGEWVGNGEALFSILKESTQEVIFYVPQSAARGFERIGKMAFHEESRGVALTGRIHRVDPQLSKAPESIETFYHRHEPLVAVHVVPDPHGRAWPVLPMNGIVRLPWLETITPSKRNFFMSLWRRR